MNINCIIIDDEPLAIKVIKNHLQNFKNITIVASYNNPIEAISIIESNSIDIIFLDINMSKMNGIYFLKSITIKPYVIITTAYQEYAIESYELNVLDYLVKPISFPRFLKSINKLTQQVFLTRNNEKAKSELDSYIFLKVNKKLVKIKFKEINYIESLKDYIKIFTSNNSFIVHKSLTSITKELPSSKFIRIHRSFTIALDKVDFIEGNLVGIGEKRITIGRKYIHNTKQVILNQK